MQSVPITTKVVSLNLGHVEVYSIQHYACQWFSAGPPVSSYKSDRHEIAEILLKVPLNTTSPTT